MGPPDLCCYQSPHATDAHDASTWFSSWFKGGAHTHDDAPPHLPQSDSEVRFHWVLGLDARNALALGNYIRMLDQYFSHVNSGWFSQSNLALQNAAILIWNPFRQMDLCLQVHLPGSLNVHWLKYHVVQDSPAAQHKIDIDLIPFQSEKDTTQLNPDQLWNETYTFSVLRYCAYVNKLPIQSNATRVLDLRPHLSPESEHIILNCIESNMHLLHRSGTHYKYFPEEPNKANNQLIHALREYFVMQSKHTQGIAFFNKLAEECQEPAFYTLSASLYMDIEQDEAADKLISKAMQSCAPQEGGNDDAEEQPQDDQVPSSTYSTSYIYLALQQCEVYCHKLKCHGSLSKFQVQYAQHLLDNILKVKENLRCAHLFYAQIVGASDPQRALLELNKVPFIPAHIPSTTNLPPIDGSSALQDLPKWLRIIKQNYSFPIQQDTVIHTAGLYTKMLPGLFLTQAEQELYQVLVLLLQQHGWKNLLQARSSAFLMQSDIEKAKQSAMPNTTTNAPASTKPQTAQTQSSTSSSPAVTLHIPDLNTNEARETIENKIQDLNFVTAVNVDVDTRVALIALSESRSERIVNALIGEIESVGFSASLDAPESDSVQPDEEPLNVSVVGDEGEAGDNSNSTEEPTEDPQSSEVQEQNFDKEQNSSDEQQEQEKFHDVDINDESSDTQQKKSEKMFCQKYFDSLFGVLHQDLLAFNKYQKESKEQLELYTSLDWSFVGSLLERIGYEEAAMVCYKRSISLGVNTKSLLRLLEKSLHKVAEIGTKRSRAEYMDILSLVDQSIVAHESNLFRYDDPIQIVNQHPLVVKSLRIIVSEVGVSHVRELVKELFGARSPVSVFVLDELLFDLIRMQCDGFSK